MAHVGKGVDSGGERAAVCDEIGHEPSSGDHDDAFGLDPLGQLHGRRRQLLLVLRVTQMFRKLQSGYRFGFQRNPAEELDALHRILPNGGFAGQHDGIGFFVDGVGDVGDLGPGRMRVVDHGFEEMRRHDHAFAVLGA